MSLVEVTWDVDRNTVPDHMERAQEAYRIFVRKSADHLAYEVGRESPVGKTRELSESWHVRPVTADFYQVFSTAEHAEWVLEGTGVYGPTGRPLMPTSAKALKFYWDKTGSMTMWRGNVAPDDRGGFVAWAEDNEMQPFLRWPKGMEGRDYISPAIETTKDRLDFLMRRSLLEVRAIP